MFCDIPYGRSGRVVDVAMALVGTSDRRLCWGVFGVVDVVVCGRPDAANRVHLTYTQPALRQEIEQLRDQTPAQGDRGSRAENQRLREENASLKAELAIAFMANSVRHARRSVARRLSAL